MPNATPAQLRQLTDACNAILAAEQRGMSYLDDGVLDQLMILGDLANVILRLADAERQRQPEE